jgi:hypothetical protein
MVLATLFEAFLGLDHEDVRYLFGIVVFLEGCLLLLRGHLLDAAAVEGGQDALGLALVLIQFLQQLLLLEVAAPPEFLLGV